MKSNKLFRSEKETTRRQLLGGILGAIGLAGCMGDNSSEQTETQQAEGAQGARGNQETATPTETGFNDQTNTAITDSETPTDPTQTETTGEYTTETGTNPGTSNTTTGNNNSSTNTAELFNQLPDPNKLYESGAIRDDEELFSSEGENTENLENIPIHVYNVEDMVNDLDQGIVEQLNKGTENRLAGRGFVGAEWKDVINKTVIGDGDIGTATLDMDYADVIAGIEATDEYDITKNFTKNTLKHKGQENGRDIYQAMFRDIRTDIYGSGIEMEVELSVEKTENGTRINWAGKYPMGSGNYISGEPVNEEYLDLVKERNMPAGFIGDLTSARKVLDQTVDGEVDSYTEGEGKYNEMIRKTQEETGNAQTAEFTINFEEEMNFHDDLHEDGQNKQVEYVGQGTLSEYASQQKQLVKPMFYMKQKEGEIKYNELEDKTEHIEPSDEEYNVLAGTEEL